MEPSAETSGSLLGDVERAEKSYTDDEADEATKIKQINEFAVDVHKCCQKFLGGGWARSVLNDIKIEAIRGGLYNYIYICSLSEDIEIAENEHRKVLLRIYGVAVDNVYDDHENTIFTFLSERDLGPRLLGIFPIGRIEEFIPFRYLSRKELAYKEITKLVARKLAEYHSVKIPLIKNPSFLWKKIEKYLSILKYIKFKNPDYQILYESLLMKMNFEQEYAWLKRMLIALDSPIVFCHNDLYNGNILYNTQNFCANKRIVFMNHDYSSYNYRGYDIGNYFCELMYETEEESLDGFTSYPNDYPDHNYKVSFANNYLDKVSKMQKKINDSILDPHKHLSAIRNCTVEKLLNEANRFVLASHFLWGLWAIIKQKTSDYDFAYLNYAQERFEGYVKKKMELGY